VRSSLSAFLGLIVFSWAIDALACSCARRGSPDLHEDLQGSKAAAVAIYVAEVVQIDDAALPGRTVLMPREVFKGNIERGKEHTLPIAGLGDCSFPFVRGEAYLIYEDAEQPYVWGCSRTKRAREGDPEIEWLRTGLLPRKPVALQRGTVNCEPCDFDRVAAVLLGLPDTSNCPPTPSKQEVSELIRARRPTFASQYLGGGARRGAGIDAAGGSFELNGSKDRGSCDAHVERRTCNALELRPDGDRDYRLECIGPGPTAVLCEQRKARHENWRPAEEIADVRCDWTDLMAPTCSIPEKPRASARSAGSGPTLRCVRSPRDEGRYDCQLVPRT
jgi:hypothetical protein